MCLNLLVIGTHGAARAYACVRHGNVDPASHRRLCILREHRGEPFYEAKFRHGGRQVKRRIGPAWLICRSDRRASGAAARPGARRRTSTSGVRTWPPPSSFAHVKDFNEAERVERSGAPAASPSGSSRTRYLDWLEKVRGAKPSTMRSHRSVLAEPGSPHKRGTGQDRRTTSWPRSATRPAAKVTTRPRSSSCCRRSPRPACRPRTVNRAREIVCAAFNYGMKPTSFSLPTNPALDTDRRRVPSRRVLDFYSPEEIEAIARSLESGFHRPPCWPAASSSSSRTSATARRCASPPIAGCAWASCWRCAGATSTGPDRRSRSAARSPPASRARPRPDTSAGSRWPTSPPPRSTACLGAGISPPRTTTSSVTPSAGRWMARRCAAATRALATPPACARCAGTTSDTPSGRCSSPAASTS